ncbi:Electron transport complex subunit RnfG [Pseudomonas fluorescens]|uniref:Ion-translocating oxidoreductase complex subunit G n=1 Tax=Pseudomonas fluorescens TaxID=294 RepID=A0A5E6UYF0_PSEFL|nr:RnfABCDGE type electron transport complex subunit G [Pseudomonas fluorescens]VVN08024.1 Electron transport complex subunit RnfG [Pseudomonas fluorescens]
MNRTSSVIILLLLAMTGAGATYLVYYTSTPHIAAEQRLIDRRNLLDLLPADSYDNDPLQQPLQPASSVLTHSRLLAGYLATKGGQPSAVLLQSETIGYAGAIVLMIAIDTHGKLLGVKTLSQSETQGLGARIADWPNAWLQGFTGKSRTGSPDNAWALRKDQGQFDQIAGATITSRAVINAVHDALKYFDAHSQMLTGNSPHE